MYSYKIDNLEQWTRISTRMKAAGYARWITQFGLDREEGFHAFFWSSGKDDVEIITFDRLVRDAIMEYKRD